MVSMSRLFLHVFRHTFLGVIVTLTKLEFLYKENGRPFQIARFLTQRYRSSANSASISSVEQNSQSRVER